VVKVITDEIRAEFERVVNEFANTVKAIG